MDRDELYRPLLERTLDNYQLQHLARKYDFGKESLVSKLLVTWINKSMDEAEASIGITRVRPFCLYIKNKDGQALLPLFSPHYLKPMLEGRSYSAARSKVLEELLKIYKKSFRKKYKGDLLSTIYPWPQTRFRSIKNYKKNLLRKPSPYDGEDNQKWDQFIGSIDPVSPLKRLDVLDGSAPEKVVEKLTQFVKEEVGFGNILARQLVEDIITIRAVVCPRTSQLRSGEMPMLVTHVSARLSEDTDTRYRKLSPVIITVLSKEEELEGFPNTMDEYLAIFAKRILRVCFEA